MSTFSVSGVEQKTVDALVAKLRSDSANTVQQNGNEFLVHGGGVTANVMYNPVAKTLAVDVTGKPFFVPMSMIEARLRDQIAEAA